MQLQKDNTLWDDVYEACGVATVIKLVRGRTVSMASENEFSIVSMVKSFVFVSCKSSIGELQNNLNISVLLKFVL